MKIYTKKGDGGTTQLIGGTRVPKHAVRIEAYGTVDELNAHVGLLRDLIEQHDVVGNLIEIQDRLFTLGSLLASDGQNQMKLPELKQEDITTLEQQIDAMDAELEPMRQFVLPGGHQAVSQCHVTRCVCRRAERVITYLKETETVDPIILQYMNRLSDYLFVLGRFLAKKLNCKEQAWNPRY